MNKYGWLFLTVVSILLTVGSCPAKATETVCADGACIEVEAVQGPPADPTPAPELCQDALSACDQLQKDQSGEISGLQEQVKEWKVQAEKGVGSDAPITLYTALGGAVSGLAVGEVNGKSGLVGAGIGAAIGAVIGLAIGGLAQ